LAGLRYRIQTASSKSNTYGSPFVAAVRSTRAGEQGRLAKDVDEVEARHAGGLSEALDQEADQRTAFEIEFPFSFSRDAVSASWKGK